MRRPAAAAALAADGRARVELYGDSSLSELTLVLACILLDDYEDDIAVDLTRPEVEQLRDALTEWLQRGAL